jgi:molybdopterin molybdotransferase
MINGYCHSIDRLRCHADDLPLLVETLDTDHDLVITSGGVSAGEKDHVPVAVIKSGWEQQFHRVSIKPGKPALFATRNEQFLFGLPGNPLSAAVTCAVFILPLLKRMNGMESIDLLLDSALLVGHPFKSNRTIIWPGTIERTSSTATATYSSKRSSAALSALLKSDGLIFQNVSTEFSGEKVGVCDWSRIL